MSSFITIKERGTDLSLGNPTFKLLISELERMENNAEAATIVTENPIAECIGGLVLNEPSEGKLVTLLEVAKILQKKLKSDPKTDSGFDRVSDLKNFEAKLKDEVKAMQESTH